MYLISKEFLMSSYLVPLQPKDWGVGLHHVCFSVILEKATRIMSMFMLCTFNYPYSSRILWIINNSMVYLNQQLAIVSFYIRPLKLNTLTFSSGQLGYNGSRFSRKLLLKPTTISPTWKICKPKNPSRCKMRLFLQDLAKVKKLNGSLLCKLI